MKMCGKRKNVYVCTLVTCVFPTSAAVAMNFLPGNVIFHIVVHLTGILAWCVLSVYTCDTVHL